MRAIQAAHKMRKTTMRVIITYKQPLNMIYRINVQYSIDLVMSFDRIKNSILFRCFFARPRACSLSHWIEIRCRRTSNASRIDSCSQIVTTSLCRPICCRRCVGPLLFVHLSMFRNRSCTEEWRRWHFCHRVVVSRHILAIKSPRKKEETMPSSGPARGGRDGRVERNENVKYYRRLYILCLWFS